MRTFAAVAVALAALASTPTLAGGEQFRTPSGRIGCLYARYHGAYLRCDIEGVSKPRPPGCDLDYGGAFEMRPNGRAHRICAGDTVLCPRLRGFKTCYVLAYSSTWRRGGFRCVSQTAGLRCT